jgi:hypothetical protein
MFVGGIWEIKRTRMRCLFKISRNSFECYCLILLDSSERIFWNEPNLCFVFDFVLVDCIFVSECRFRLIVRWIWMLFCNWVKLLRALNKSLYRYTILRHVELLSRLKAIVLKWAHVIDCNFHSVKMIVIRLCGFFWWSFVTFVNAFVLLNTYCPGWCVIKLLSLNQPF